MTALTAQFGGRKELIQLDEVSSVPAGLVFQLAKDLGKRGVGQMFGELMILQHPGHIQSFDIDRLVLADGRSREFMDGVGAVGDLVKTYKFEHQQTKTAMHGMNLRYVSARASFRAGKSKNGNYRLRQNHR